MNKEKVHISLLLDESGSMQNNQHAVVTGTNEFIDNLRDETQEKDVRATLSMFDARVGEDVVRVKWSDIGLEDCPKLAEGQYNPHGSTPLNDAVVKSIKHLESVSSEGEKVMLVIFTDGYENASETKTEDVRKAIMAKEEEGWKFIYLGANQDAWAEGSRRGFAASHTYNTVASPDGMKSAMRSGSVMAANFSTLSTDEYETTSNELHDKSGGNIGEEDETDLWTPEKTRKK